MTRRTANLLVLLAFLALAGTAHASDDGCRPEPVTPNTPTGIAGCERAGEGIASHYGPGDGVAMNFCTWQRRHSIGCGFVTITAVDTGLTVTVPVVDYCDCFTGTADERIVDLQYGVVAALGLDVGRGLYPVVVTHQFPATPAPFVLLPDTAVAP